MDYTKNKEVVQRIREIDDKIHEGNITDEEYTKLMFEQLLRGIYLQY
jgi:hypothetical protein